MKRWFGPTAFPPGVLFAETLQCLVCRLKVDARSAWHLWVCTQEVHSRMSASVILAYISRTLEGFLQPKHVAQQTEHLVVVPSIPTSFCSLQWQLGGPCTYCTRHFASSKQMTLILTCLLAMPASMHLTKAASASAYTEVCLHTVWLHLCSLFLREHPCKGISFLLLREHPCKDPS